MHTSLPLLLTAAQQHDSSYLSRFMSRYRHLKWNTNIILLLPLVEKFLEMKANVMRYFLWLTPATTFYFLKGLATGSVTRWYSCQTSSLRLVVYKIFRYIFRYCCNKFQWTCQTGDYPEFDAVDIRCSFTGSKAAKSWTWPLT